MVVTMSWLLSQILMRLGQQVKGGSVEALPFTSPEDLMKNLPKVLSNMFGKGAGGGMLRDSPTFKITMKEYDELAIRVGDKVGIEINKVDSSEI
jgi:hypothetical protein